MYPVEIRDMPPMTLYGLEHRGPYHEIGPKFEELGSLLGQKGLIEAATLWVGVYHDDPDDTAPADLRSHACCALGEGAQPPGELEPLDVPGGRAAVLGFKGDYAGLAGAWNWLYSEWLPQSGETVSGPACEIYRTMAPAVPVEEQLTEIVVILG